MGAKAVEENRRNTSTGTGPSYMLFDYNGARILPTHNTAMN